MKNKISFFCLLFSVFCSLSSVFCGCGYTTRSMLSTKYRTIYIAPFVNKVDVTNQAYSENKYRIYRPMLETNITRGVINKYLFDGNLKPVKEEAADLALKSELIEYRKDPLSYTADNNDVVEYRINIYVNLTLWDRKENKILWEEKNFNGNYSYYVRTSTIIPGNNVVVISEDSAVSKAVDDLSRRIVERTVEQW